MKSHPWLISGLAVLLLGSIACGGDRDPVVEQQHEPASIVVFTATPSKVKAGELVSVMWETRHAVEIELTRNGQVVELGEGQLAAGSISVPVEERSIFELKAFGSSGDPARQTATVELEVEPGEDPRVISFSADPAELDEGESTVLSWTTENADSVEIVNAANHPVELGGAGAAQGSVSVSMDSSTTFTLKATKGDKEATSTATVKVRGSPMATLEVSPSRIDSGATSTLAWATEGAVSVVITDGDGATLVDSTERLSGTLPITPASTTTYTLTAIGTTKQTVATAVVEVTPAITLFEAVDPSPAGVGDMKELRWKVAGASHVELTNGGEFTISASGVDAADGRAMAPMGPSGTYELVATSGTLQAKAQLQIPILDLPTIGSFAAAKDAVTFGVDGKATATLRWSNVAGATQLILEGDTIAPVAVDASMLVAGAADVEITADTIFTLVAKNSAGEASKLATVRVVAPPIIQSLTASPMYVAAGETIDLTWATAEATSVVVMQDGVTVPGTHPTSGTLAFTVGVSTSFKLYAYNDARDFVSETLIVVVGLPTISTFTTTTPGVWLGGAITFAWESQGASELTISSPAGVVCTKSVRAEIEQGSCTTPPMTVEGVTVYTLEVTNTLAQVATKTVSVQVSAGPMITDFTVTPASLTVGQPFTVAWETTPDPDGVAPTLALTADRGGPFTLPEGSSGTMPLTLTEPGAYTFTLTASTPTTGSVSATSSQSVHAYAPPTVTLVADSPVFDEDIHTDVELTWTSSNAEGSLMLYELDEAGAEVLLQSVPQPERPTGSFSVIPTRATTYRIVATNGLGARAWAEASVILHPTEVLTFTATAPEYPTPPAPPTVAVVAGDEVSLRWTTKRATSVDLDLPFGSTFSETAEPYLDVAGSGGILFPFTSSTWVPSVGDEGQDILTFPDGFIFPFGGEDHTSVMVYANGVLSFDLATVRNMAGPHNVAFPDTSKAWAHLGVFWDDLNFDTSPIPGSVYWKDGTDSRGAYLAIEWKHIGFGSAGGSADMSFEVILRESGAFEYRYGAMTPISASIQLVAGSSATIGYQLPDGSDSHTFSSDAAVPGGLQYRSFIYERPAPIGLDGSFGWHPPGGAGTVTRTATLTASGVGVDSKTVSVLVHPRASVTLSGPASSPFRNTPFTLSWTTQNASGLTIVDSSDSAVCTAAPNRVASGSCDLVATTNGDRTYTAVLTGALGHTVRKDIPITVIPANFAINSFDVSADGVNYGEAVTLSWDTGDADLLEITANGAPLALPPTTDFNSDSFTIPSLTEATTFVLTITNTETQTTRTATRTVDVRTFSFDLVADALEVAPGAPFDLTWTSTSFSGGAVEISVPNYPMVEDDSGLNSFIDLSAVQGVQTLTLTDDSSGKNDHTFQDFSFPFDGQVYTRVQVMADGYLSFTPSAYSNGYNNALPSATYPTVHLAPFWDDLHRRSGTIRAALVGTDYVISWDHFSPVAGSTPNAYDLNFQVVLHPNGSFEYRYGAMDPPNPAPPICPGGSCAAEANAASATIGYSTGGTNGHTIHFGGTYSAATNEPLPGGLANRTFRYDPPPSSGTLTVNPKATSDYEVCATLGGFTECKTVHVVAEYELVSFEPSAATIDRGATIDLSWVTKNADTLTLRSGATVLATEASVNMDAGSIAVSPTETTTYTLEVRNTFRGQTLTSTQTVTVKQFDLGLTAAGGGGNPGDPVTLTWSASTFSGLPTVLTTPMAEITGTSAFTDISLDTNSAVLIGAQRDTDVVAHSFGAGFSFDYLGVNYTSVRVATDGYLSFDPSTATNATNVNLPNTTTAARKVQIAPFWDNLHTRSYGSVHVLASPSEYVIQWSHVSMATGSTTAGHQHDLNFQVVLKADGSFQYRYGLMAGLPSHQNSTACFPNTCANEANGSAATIGYQNLEGTAGYQLYFGGVSPSARNFPFGGGLSHRAFEFSPYSTSSSMTVNPYDTTDYRICAISGAFVECSEVVRITADWEILSFTASAPAVPTNAPVTLSWVTTGGDGIELKAAVGTAAATALPVTGLNVTADSYTDSLIEKTTYTLTLESAGRSKTATATVIEQTVAVDLIASHSTVHWGDPVTLTWDVTPHAPGTPMIATPMVELSGPGTRFADLDVSSDSTLTPIISTGSSTVVYLSFDGGFTFPFMGATHDSVRVSTDGYLSFAPDATTAGSNQVIPNSNPSYNKVSLAPFWDDLDLRTSGRVYAKLLDPDTYVVQWSHVSAAGSSNTSEYDLNFMVVLRSDGTFEYRYGTMAPPPDTSSGCYPITCENEANGSSATIGYQDPTGAIGNLVHFGGTEGGLTNPTFFGGLANRALVFSSDFNNSIVVSPSETTSYDVCASLAGYSECKVVTVNVLSQGDLVITELMLDPDGGPANQWFEVKNTTLTELDLEGWEISSTSGTHMISGALLVPPQGYAVFKASASTLSGGYVYGPGLSLAPGGDTLTVKAGPVVMTSVTWDETWTVPHAASLELEPTKARRAFGVFTSEADFCAAESMYDGVNHGTPGVNPSCSVLPYLMNPNSALPFLDISETGTFLFSLSGDITTQVNVPFSMPFFETTVNKIWANANGYISFSQMSPSIGKYAPHMLPRSAAESPTGPLVAMFFDDLGCSQDAPRTTSAYYGQWSISGQTVTIVQYNNYKRCDYLGSITFQIQLWSGGDIVIAFDRIEAGGAGAQAIYEGSEAWIGLESPNRDIHVTALLRERSLLPGQTIHFQRR